ncbi:GDSL esterase/lipase At1g71691 [Linum grandiflorum]
MASSTKLFALAAILATFCQLGSGQFFNGTVGGGDASTDARRGSSPAPEALAPAMFVFGDSLIDNGNNNNLPSFAKANYLPYGIDFNGGPTGRFCNGYTIVDQIAEQLGLPLIPPYSQGGDVTRGVNYASAAAGILDATGRNFVSRIPFDQQIRNFQNTLDRLSGNLGAVDLARDIGRSIFFVGMGSNDYLNNYLMPNYPTRQQYNGQQYADLLVQQYTRQLTMLYNLGARKVAIAGLGEMGCIPSILSQSPAGGFRVTNRGCCGIGRNAGQITCLPFQTPCRNRAEYIFWDAFHPTEAVNVMMGKKAFNGDMSYVYPINIEQLARIG